ncbi:transcriptional regulator, GntR family [Peptoanaerobacter stomatis]|uniref:Transcriptional regulator, GntR family n=1 Tax=Peptoanaerobacter stomatis TaxID=796937 RepID=J5WK13_9FIRM|nr:GntR family transcriptional regulator [Peptoanaerobacter stomatis]EJU22527.1 transcriptional regulator, GntR family [Peptoanaerobacter stomatis]NWO25438.1 GntR family transcriptional regulator [Peptostreptococcaceae bacterium oral taxon 081]
MIQVDVRSRVPIYEQIINSIKQMSISGVLLPDEKLPSVRELAKDMTINPNTIQKAYQELERQGIIYIKRGQGTFINPDIKAKNKEEKMANLKETINTIVVESIYLGISKEELIEIIKSIYEENQV